MAARLAPGVREDPRLVRESVESTRYGAMNGEKKGVKAWFVGGWREYEC